MAKVALIMSGSGHLDGSEIHETVLCMLHLANQGHSYQAFAPDKSQKRVMDHLKRKEISETRNCLIEAARIARGKIDPLEKLHEKDFDAILLPGGMGAALNLCDFAVEGVHCNVEPILEKIIQDFYRAKKPIGATCIAPVIIAKALEKIDVKAEMTLGSVKENQKILEQMGMINHSSKVDMCVSDKKHKVYTTPCYMEPEDLAGMSLGIASLVKNMFS